MTTRKIASTFPNHPYDFGDRVYVLPIQRGGVVQGILRSDNGSWRYFISGLGSLFDVWWLEDQLEPACPRCLSPWDETHPCSNCGFTVDDLI
ncbi:hypothetical protein [Egbenema bharatensis]|uniref:hypothetical protein n=1 Tax=Egbenema bharatensis TaxID=3463334 RepID=UPI003A8A07D8